MPYIYEQHERMLRRLLAAVRVNEWWHHILPPIIGFYFLGTTYTSSADILAICAGLGKLLFISIPVAAFGYYLNEWTDIEDDRAGGKRNFAGPLSVKNRWLLFSSIMTGILAGLIFLPLSLEIRLLIVLQVTLLSLYSCQPFRLKRVPWAAVMLDALYSGTIFFVLAFLLSGSASFQTILLIIMTGLLKGVRSIIHHLMLDADKDAASGQRTVAHLISKRRLFIGQEVIWFGEVVLILWLSHIVSIPVFWIMFGAVILLLVKRRYYTHFGGEKGNDKTVWLKELNVLYEVWIPIAGLVIVLFPFGWWVPVLGVGVMMFLFPGTLRIFPELYLAVLNAYYFVRYVLVFIWHRIYYFFYNIYYAINDLYFIHTKPHFDIGKFWRRLRGK